MKKTLMPFQVTGERFLMNSYHALLAWEMGLGKTCTTISAIEKLGLKNILVICPASVRSGWKLEIEECLGKDEGRRWDIISYNAATDPKHRANLADSYDVIVCDESHFLRTPEAARTLAIFGDAGGLARRAKYKWMLSGTPVLNRPRELYVVLRCLAAGKIAPYGDFSDFAQRFCSAYFDGRSINTKGASNLDDLSQRIMGGSSPFMHRRTKAETFPELPTRIVKRIPVEVSAADWKAVEDVEREIVDREAFISTTHENFSQLGDIAMLRRTTGLAKVRAVAAFVDDLLETIDKIVVFTWHRDVLTNLIADLSGRGRGCVAFQGGMSDTAKTAAVYKFVNDANCQVFVGNMQAAGTGLNGLQVANDVVLAEPDWTPGTMDQAIARVDRMGKQSPGPVTAYIPYIPGSLESSMLGVGDRKTKIIERLLGGSWNAQPSLLEGLV